MGPSTPLNQAGSTEANCLAYVTAALIRLAVARGAQYIIEQPQDSKMFLTAPLQKAFRMSLATKVSTYLKAFSPTFLCNKGLTLYGTADCMRALQRNPPLDASGADESVYARDHFGGISGGPALAKTAAYPPEFGHAVGPLALPLAWSSVQVWAVRKASISFVCSCPVNKVACAFSRCREQARGSQRCWKKTRGMWQSIAADEESDSEAKQYVILKP